MSWLISPFEFIRILINYELFMFSWFPQHIIKNQQLTVNPLEDILEIGLQLEYFLLDVLESQREYFLHMEFLSDAENALELPVLENHRFRNADIETSLQIQFLLVGQIVQNLDVVEVRFICYVCINYWFRVRK